ncbi:MAG TPA: hypothetical protein VFP12_16825 [Allosphingosinicella sp.]|nr:hypothetical protein [Allosphingosinicella sp.]
MDNIDSWFSSPIFKGMVSAITTIGLLIVIINFFSRAIQTITISYRVSMLGLPRAGKTALVAAMFGEIFSDPRKDFKPVGPETISRINQFIEMLDTGTAIAPTHERDAFIFRFIYYIRRLFVIARIRYEGEVVDFPGEMSERLFDAEETGMLRGEGGLFGREFYSWIISAKAVIFVIDVGHYLSSDRRAFVARMTSEIRTAWQLLQEEGSHGFRPGTKRIALVFTKMDAVRAFSNQNGEDYNKLLSRIAFEEPFTANMAPSLDGYEELLAETVQRIKVDFADLIKFFSARERYFSIFFVSAYLRMKGERFGIKELLTFVLPNLRTASEN